LSNAQLQPLVLAGLCLAGCALMVLVPSSRRTRFGVFAALNFLLAGALFTSVAVFGFDGERSEVVVALLSELPVVFLISWVCLAQAGSLPTRASSLPAEPVARRPRLRTSLKAAPLLLLLAWSAAATVGLLWPSPAMEPYAPAGPQFVVFKLSISVAEGYFAGLAALVFAMAAWSAAGVRTLLLKNVAFSVSMFCLVAIAVESSLLAGARLWAAHPGRRAMVDVLLTFEAYAAALCFLTLALGVTLRYTPEVASTLVRRLHIGWLPAQERLESFRWRTVAGGGARGMIRASHNLAEAAKLWSLPHGEVEKAVTTIQLVATMKDPSAEGARITPEAARNLYVLQEEVLGNENLASKISWTTGWGSHARRAQTVHDASLHDALEAALDLIDPQDETVSQKTRPLWHHLAAVSAADVGLVDPDSVETQLGQQPGYRIARETYRAAKASLRSRAFDARRRTIR
jgi:hypothetical protein